MFEFLNSVPEPIVSLFGFILTISFLVTIHEYGHFWMARKFKVKIEKFSIGFGKPIIKWYGKRDNTEYSIAWIPLGGYVKMYGENPIENNKSTDIKTKNLLSTTHDNSDITLGSEGSFYLLSPFKRFLIASAGPMVNLIFAVIALWILFVIGIPAFKPYVGTITPQSIFANANIQSGAKIIAIDGNSTDTLTDTTLHLINNLGKNNVSITTSNNNSISKKTT
ncbi:MAG: RIP metalloprotease RseP, partial [Ostreibacterium sp.]